LSGLVTRAGEGKHAPTLEAGDLSNDVGRGAKPVEAEPLGVAGHSEGAIADESRAQQWSDLKVGVSVGERKAVTLVGDCPLGEATVDVSPGEARDLAKVLPATEAGAAATARPTKPRDADARAGLQRLGVSCSLTATDHGPDNLVAGNDRRSGNLDLAVEQVQVGAAHTARMDPHEELVGSRLGLGKLHGAQRAGTLALHRSHPRDHVMRPRGRRAAVVAFPELQGPHLCGLRASVARPAGAGYVCESSSGGAVAPRGR